MRPILPLIYRKGQPQTGIALTDLPPAGGRFAPGPDSHGAPWRSRLCRHCERRPAGREGQSVSKFEQPIAIYYTAEPFFMMPVAGQTLGRYRLRLELSTERMDIAPSCCFEHQ